MSTPRLAVFFDRDNTLIINDGYLGDPAGVVLMPGAADAVARARQLGYAVVTISNQSGVARGMFDESAVQAVDRQMDHLLLARHPDAIIDLHVYCPYHPDAVVPAYRKQSDLRKPAPGMILLAAQQLGLDLSRSWVIGDAPRDIQAGINAGCKTILFHPPDVVASSALEDKAVPADFTADSLKQAMDWIAGHVDHPIDMTGVTLAVLAGGAGTRMGLPKQNLRIGDRPILEWLLDRFAWPGPTLLVTTPGRERPAGVGRFDAEAVDAVENQGPLRGVLTALQHAGTACVVVATVDMPGMEQTHLAWVAARLMARPELSGLMLRREMDRQPRIEPFPFACRTDAVEMIARRLADGRRSVHSLADVAGFTVEDAPADWPAVCWTNLNSPGDLWAYLQKC